MVCNQSLGKHNIDRCNVRLLVDEQNGANEKCFVFVHQHGGYDVTWKAPIEEHLPWWCVLGLIPRQTSVLCCRQDCPSLYCRSSRTYETSGDMSTNVISQYSLKETGYLRNRLARKYDVLIRVLLSASRLFVEERQQWQRKRQEKQHVNICTVVAVFAIIPSCSNSTRLAKHATTGLVCARLSSKLQMG